MFRSIETEAADNWKPSKKKSRERIDGTVAQNRALERSTTDEAFASTLLVRQSGDGVNL